MKRRRARTQAFYVVDAQDALQLNDIPRLCENARALGLDPSSPTLARELESAWAQLTPTSSGQRARAKLETLRDIKRRVLASHAALHAFCQQHQYHTAEYVLQRWLHNTSL